MPPSKKAQESAADIHAGIADVEFEASKKAAMEALEKLLEAREHFQLAATSAGMDLKQEAIQQLLTGKSKAEELGQELNELAQSRPLATLSLAFLGGFVLAQMMGRK